MEDMSKDAVKEYNGVKVFLCLFQTQELKLFWELNWRAMQVDLRGTIPFPKESFGEILITIDVFN